MSEALNESNIQAHLTAFADGELDAAQILEVLHHLSAHPEALEMLRIQQQLRLSAFRSIRKVTPPVPDDLKRRIDAIVANDASDRDESKRIIAQKAGFGWVWRGIAAAVLLGIGIYTGNLLPWHKAPTSVSNPELASGIPSTLIAAVTRVHVDCSRFAPQLHSGPFPTTAPLGALATDVEKEFHTQVPYPDLSSIGYSFVGAGPCRKPLENTVHLLYRSVKPTLRDTLSVFVQPYKGQVTIQPDRMILVGGADSAHPSFVWRTQNAVYFLVTDDLQIANQARDVMQIASAR